MFEVPLWFLESEGFNRIYDVTSKMALIISLPLGVYMCLKLMSNRVNEYQLKIVFIRMFFLPIFIMVAPKILTEFLKVVNRVSNILLDLEMINRDFEIQGDLHTTVTIIFLVIFLYLVIKLIIYYAKRNFAIIFLIIISPLLYLIWSMPGRFNKMNAWITEISNLFLTQLVHVIQLLILLMIVRSGVEGLTGLVLQVGALLYMVETPVWLEKYIGSTMKIPDVKMRKYVNYMRKPAKSLLRNLKKIYNEN